MAGYRVPGMDYDTGSGDQFFKHDVITQGIVPGVYFRFWYLTSRFAQGKENR
jgi:hypothetical protein